jgi:hypothetical protein
VPDYAPVRVMLPLKFQKIVEGSEHTRAIATN